ncbi:hypothetical protein [Thiomicrospira pelophila]|uniref:hypothetical protein n=1 Tax=Thiomicrospira pelophila TaxID=934 RepID=UPI00138E4E9C|nr:hypothetical protein [Thiomicrospira pelophila]
MSMNTSMRQREILSIEWQKVDRIIKVIKITGENSKSKSLINSPQMTRTVKLEKIHHTVY